MPVIGIPVEDLRRRIGREMAQDDLLVLLGDLGCDVEGLAVLERRQCVQCGFVMELAGKEEVPLSCDQCQAELRGNPGAVRELRSLEVVRMELLAVRPDMFDPAGLARAIRGWLSVETGPVRYAIGPPAATVRVDPSVRRSTSWRPHIACAIVEGVAFDEDSIKVLMKLQENLHWALGRNRKHASIGVYDLDSLQERERFEYLTEDPETFRFLPLGSTETTAAKAPNLQTILEEHPKGRAYAGLLEGFDRYPILRSATGEVLSMPPIINSEATRVHQGSTRLFIDVTGTGSRIANRTLNILVTSLLDYHRTARLRAVTLEGATPPDTDGREGATTTLVSPDLSAQTVYIDAGRTSRLLGIDTPPAELRLLLERMRHEVQQEDGTRLRVEVPAYRNDILHERDLMEDAAIAFGYRNIPRTLVPSLTVGGDLPATRRAESVRAVLTGLGFIEVMTLLLTSPEQSDRLLGFEGHPASVVLANPISNEQTQLRTSLLPGLLWTLARNRHNPLPQEVFEVAEVTFLEAPGSAQPGQGPAADTGAAERLHAGFAQIAAKTGFAEARALLEAVVRELGWPLRLRAADLPCFITGRCAVVLGPNDVVSGVVGEVHPRLLEVLGLQNPAIAAEVCIDGPPWALRSFPEVS